MNIESIIPPALALGFVGSYHCVAMCGVIAAQTRAESVAGTLARHLQYSAGRMLTYTLLAVSLYGIGALGAMNVGQHVISLAAGSIVLIGVVMRMVFAVSIVPPGLYTTLYALLARLRTAANSVAPAPMRSFFLGVFNGFLPCGFVYMALALSLMQPGMAQSALWMAAFGAGTIPAMLLLVLGFRFRPLEALASSPKFRVGASAVAGVLLVLRGLALGIPYVSPSIPASVEVLSSIKHGGTCLPQATP